MSREASPHHSLVRSPPCAEYARASPDSDYGPQVVEQVLEGPVPRMGVQAAGVRRHAPDRSGRGHLGAPDRLPLGAVVFAGISKTGTATIEPGGRGHEGVPAGRADLGVLAEGMKRSLKDEHLRPMRFPARLSRD
jgi:hypothetical protein